MVDRVLQYIREHHMIEDGDCIVAGVSGGADSVCLLLMLLEIRKVIPMEIRVVHVNHMIRADAAEDADYVRKLCLANKVSFTLAEEDVEAVAHRLHLSTEEAGREVRYAAFEKELGTRRGKIAVAHNKNDSCETFLFHLFRGTSLKGLTGIQPVRDRIIRPLLCLSRSEIELFLQAGNVSYCIDSTNLEDNYSRNVIRHHILDTAVREISSAAVSHISDACDRMNEAYDLIADMTRQGFEACVTVTSKVYHIDRGKFLGLHKTIQGYVVMETLAQAAGSRKDLGTVHIRQIRELLDRQCGRSIQLPYQLRAKRDYTGVGIYREPDRPMQEVVLSEIVLSEEERAALTAGRELTILVGGHQKIEAKLIFVENNGIDFKNIPQKKYTKWFDYDKIERSIAIRTRRPGDYLTVNAANQRKTLKAYFIDHKIPQPERDQIRLVADGNHIIWIVGERISNYYKVSEATRTILSLTFEENVRQLSARV
ncbi:MAG: tRNA lysidine(34) synthetase TilS [Lachnospiraceae bacterium]|nr:tRNA lysidine(34) synthetase TilS [Lachnospiraceae bacterium]